MNPLIRQQKVLKWIPISSAIKKTIPGKWKADLRSRYLYQPEKAVIYINNDNNQQLKVMNYYLLKKDITSASYSFISLLSTGDINCMDKESFKLYLKLLNKNYKSIRKQMKMKEFIKVLIYYIEKNNIWEECEQDINCLFKKGYLKGSLLYIEKIWMDCDGEEKKFKEEVFKYNQWLKLSAMEFGYLLRTLYQRKGIKKNKDHIEYNKKHNNVDDNINNMNYSTLIRETILELSLISHPYLLKSIMKEMININELNPTELLLIIQYHIKFNENENEIIQLIVLLDKKGHKDSGLNQQIENRLMKICNSLVEKGKSHLCLFLLNQILQKPMVNQYKIKFMNKLLSLLLQINDNSIILKYYNFIKSQYSKNNESQIQFLIFLIKFNLNHPQNTMLNQYCYYELLNQQELVFRNAKLLQLTIYYFSIKNQNQFVIKYFKMIMKYFDNLLNINESSNSNIKMSSNNEVFNNDNNNNKEKDQIILILATLLDATSKQCITKRYFNELLNLISQKKLVLNSKIISIVFNYYLKTNQLDKIEQLLEIIFKEKKEGENERESKNELLSNHLISNIFKYIGRKYRSSNKIMEYYNLIKSQQPNIQFNLINCIILLSQLNRSYYLPKKIIDNEFNWNQHLDYYFKYNYYTHQFHLDNILFNYNLIISNIRKELIQLDKVNTDKRLTNEEIKSIINNNNNSNNKLILINNKNQLEIEKLKYFNYQFEVINYLFQQLEIKI
ncbi:hypothetical protein K502DRAFT_369026 [Neoconidiobolus thromboides FSU 785]|nr:hypothetical protein K502DRAFT_369026 [Neoconidiobolus thromboides FSU 785]